MSSTDLRTQSIGTVEKDLLKFTVKKFYRRSLEITKQHFDDVKELLRLMGIPCIDAPCEAEAQCAAMTKAGKVYASVTEDMDALPFGTTILLRQLKMENPWLRNMNTRQFSRSWDSHMDRYFIKF